MQKGEMLNQMPCTALWTTPRIRQLLLGLCSQANSTLLDLYTHRLSLRAMIYLGGYYFLWTYGKNAYELFDPPNDVTIKDDGTTLAAFQKVWVGNLVKGREGGGG